MAGRIASDYDRPHALSLVANYRLSRLIELGTTVRVQSGFPYSMPLGVRVAAVEDTSDVDGDGNATELIPQRDARACPCGRRTTATSSNLNSGRLPVFARVDLRATFRPRWQNSRWQLYVEVINLLNRRQRRHAGHGAGLRSGLGSTARDHDSRWVAAAPPFVRRAFQILIRASKNPSLHVAASIFNLDASNVRPITRRGNHAGRLVVRPVHAALFSIRAHPKRVGARDLDGFPLPIEARAARRQHRRHDLETKHLAEIDGSPAVERQCAGRPCRQRVPQETE